VVVNHLDLLRVAVLPDEADPILVVDPNAVLPLPIAGKSLKVIAWERAEVVEALGGVQLRQLPLRDKGLRSVPQLSLFSGRIRLGPSETTGG
jgi:hypothetical protein